MEAVREDRGQRAAVVGGGLAGMVAALRLRQRGFDVTLYEASNRLGGKAGSDFVADRGLDSDHGYHIFPAWYRNLWALVEELGAGEGFWRSGEFFTLARRDGAPGPGPLRFVERDFPLRVKAALADLCTRGDADVDKLTLKGFLRSRFYLGHRRADDLSDLVLKALSNHSYKVSARAMRNLFRQWTAVLDQPAWTACRGSLQACLIGPIERRLHKGGIRRGDRLEGLDLDGSELVALRFASRPAPVSVRGVPVVLAVPPEVLRGLVDEEVYRLEPRLADLEYLRSDPMGALDVHFRREIEGLPAAHFSLDGSRFALTAFDISQHWPGLKGRTVLQLMAGEVTSLRRLGEASFTRLLLEELACYLPFDPARDVDLTVAHPNVGVPLVMNDVGTWEKRPDTTTAIANLFLAGDFVRSPVDVACMESAVTTGLMAAEAVRERFAPDAPPVAILPPYRIAPWKAWLGRMLLVPAALAQRWLDALTGRAKGEAHV